MRRIRRPSSPERDGNLHIHIGAQWVVGTYHDGWHPVGRSHKGCTQEGLELHRQHMAESSQERSTKERALTAKFATQCVRCRSRITPGQAVWWNPNTKALRHRGTACDSDEREGEPEDESPAAADKIDMREVQEKIDEATGEIREQVVALERHVLDFEKKAEQLAAKIEASKRIEVVTPKHMKPRNVGIQHKHFAKLLRLANARINVAMVGDAGSGKTTAPCGVAKALGLPFYHIPIGPQTSKSDLLGFINGAGQYVYSLLCKAYESGGVALLDEMDAANPATLTIANGMIEAVEAGFADKMRKRHEDCIFMAAMNTFGRGADMLFVGRAQLDAATLNRWYILKWDTDWDLTRALVSDDEWVNYVESLYDSASRQKVRVTIGMRTAIMGKKAMLAGDTREEAEDGVIWAPITPDDKQKILAGVSIDGSQKKESGDD